MDKLSAEAAAELLLRIRYNSFPIADSAGAAEIGLGLYPAAALLNHSCAPNGALAFAAGGGALSVRAVVDIAAGEEAGCALVFAAGGGALAVRAVVDIAAGDEVTFSYIDPLQPRAARQALLKAAYAFDCSCTLCTAPGGEGGAGGDWAMVGMMVEMVEGLGEASVGGRCVLPPDGRVGEEEEVVCGTCAGRQRAMDLVRCSEAAEANLEACLKQGRATLVAFLESAEAARLSPSHHLLYQARAPRCSCFTVESQLLYN
ncbi:hypothetical protein T484DRAFT_1836266 [Baffinella frigidus]|nr:hypothetical protein T484DRAFT_1836266 [Cryptophyta sp. CCMP2293]